MSSTQLCPSLPEDEREALEGGWNEHPGLRHLGVRVDLSAPDVVRVYVDPVQPHHRGGLGTAAVNGAVMAAAFDVTIGLVGHLCHADRRTGTAQLSIHFLQPVVGDRFEILGRLTRAGRSLVFATADLHDEHGRLCSRCEGIVAVAGGPQAEAEERMAL